MGSARSGSHYPSAPAPAPVATLQEWAFQDAARALELDGRGAKVVISQHPGRAQKLKIDLGIYQWRHLIENFFCKLREFKRIALRACKTDRSFEAMIYLATGIINSR